MRLIDADELEARVVNFQGRGKKTFLEMMSSQPTAYDIDKVVEQLEEKLKEPRYQHDSEDYFVGIIEAIEIVKKGGAV